MRFTIPSGLLWFLCLPTELCAQSISKRGYPEHFIVGALIAGGVTKFVLKKTKKKRLAWTAGVLASALAGLVKEILDSTLRNKMSNWNDFNYTVLGGIVGASFVVPVRKYNLIKSLKEFSRSFLTRILEYYGLSD